MTQYSCAPLWKGFFHPHLPTAPDLIPIDALLRPGDRDHDVRILQRTLRTLGYDLEIDGIFGRTTLECVKSFQASHALARDGVVGPQTWAALQAICQEVVPHE